MINLYHPVYHGPSTEFTIGWLQRHHYSSDLVGCTNPSTVCPLKHPELAVLSIDATTDKVHISCLFPCHFIQTSPLIVIDALPIQMKFSTLGHSIITTNRLHSLFCFLGEKEKKKVSAPMVANTIQ
ncbi:hypothetical protein NPIL_589231 [Nephila pilipes]|uniref:Uncharacterized protein n=1 Tax=Nephila pilipes TaxID=299642 RepID=A0A8X6QY41_NEPPI|nr:hypothetical protein NPIL_589231 [Nephila pilipes]